MATKAVVDIASCDRKESGKSHSDFECRSSSTCNTYSVRKIRFRFETCYIVAQKESESEVLLFLPNGGSIRRQKSKDQFCDVGF